MRRARSSKRTLGASSAPLSQRAGFQSGDLIADRYRVLSRIAAGGMGEVFKVEHVELGKPFALKVMLAERGMFLSSIFASFTGKPDQARRLFDFCQEMGTGTIVAEPAADALDMLEKPCDEYRINLAFHNHARGQSPYWKPEQVLAACQNRTARMGACADAGQWARSGLDPIEFLRKRRHLIKEPGSGQGNNGVINLNLAVLFPGAERQFRGFKAKVAANDPVAGYKPASKPQGENEV